MRYAYIQLACVKHASSVHSEPGSDPSLKKRYTSRLSGSGKYESYLPFYPNKTKNIEVLKKIILCKYFDKNLWVY